MDIEASMGSLDPISEGIEEGTTPIKKERDLKMGDGKNSSVSFLEDISMVIVEEECSKDDTTNFDDDAKGELFYEDEWDGYEPSISDRLHIGYYRMDRACQTEVSDLVQLKELSDVLAFVTNDILTLQKSLYYGKCTLQAEYNGRLQEEIAKINRRVNRQIGEIEKKHNEKVDVLRRAYRTQLADALCKLSNDYHKYYGKKDADNQATHMKEVHELERQRLESRKNELLQKEMAELLLLQAEEQKTSFEDITPSEGSLDQATKYAIEIEDLNSSIADMESKIEYLEDMLEETNRDNAKLNLQMNRLTSQLSKEEQKAKELNDEIITLNKTLSNERYQAQEQLNAQKKKLLAEMDDKVNTTMNKMQNESSKQLEELKRLEAKKLQDLKCKEDMKFKEAMSQKQDLPPVPVETVDHDTEALLQVQAALKAEISRLEKELDRKGKLHDMKIKVLNEHIHVLKDEMFLRATLQRQSSKMKQAGLTYAKHGSQDIPLGVNPIDVKITERKHRLPSIIQAPKGTYVTTNDQ